ncbi:TolC family protein [Abyssisolibacter fermentans]|uniref:TolC family protein n=1 Tax=Abyssisolibacter fermentans TaxID=1766203 RepID=UPI000831596A|nr:TolC family protein [Abyssisolibacter fermentans]
MKKISVMFLVILTAFSLIGATYAENTDQLNMTLEQAVNYALEHNKDMDIENLNIQKAELSHRQVKRQIEKFNDDKEYKLSLKAYNRDLYNRMIKGVVEKQDELGLETANKNKEIKINRIKYDVEKAYFDILQAEKQVEIADEGRKLSQEQYDHSKKMFELGTISKQQLLESELNLSNAKSGYDNAVMAYDLQKLNFNRTIGLDYDTKVKLVDKFEFDVEKEEAVDLNESIKTALENNFSVYMAEQNVELGKLTLEVVKIDYPENTTKYKDQQISVMQSEKQLETAKNGIEMAVRSSYIQMQNAKKQIASYELAVTKAESAYKLSELSFKIGQGKSSDVKGAQISLEQSKYNLAKQIYAYNMAKLDFKYGLGIGY